MFRQTVVSSDVLVPTSNVSEIPLNYTCYNWINIGEPDQFLKRGLFSNLTKRSCGKFNTFLQKFCSTKN